MAVVNYFYNATTKRYIALFGTMFNKISITRNDPNTEVGIQSMVVPISYGPYQKFLARTKQDPNLDRKTAITLPRMAFEIMGMQYDNSRKVVSTKRVETTSSVGNKDMKSYVHSPTPWNIEFNLYIMTKYAEDGTQIIEQIIPFFKPEWTSTVKIIDNIEPLDIPLILNSVIAEDLYEADFETRRTLMWTLSFTMKGWYFGPVRSKGIIKFIDTRLGTDVLATTNMEEQVVIYPGLTANNEPTTDANNTVHYDLIDFDDDWGTIAIIRDEIIEP